MSAEILIRHAGTGDLESLIPLFDDYRRFYGQPSDRDGARRFLASRLERNDSAIYLATLHGQPAGFTQLYPLFSSISMSRIWLLNDLFVAASARRRGAATALLEAARKHAAESGATGLLLETTTDNVNAQTLYGRNGWEREDGFYWYALTLS